MTWIEVFLGSAITSATAIAIATFVLSESFKRVLDSRMERLRHEMSLDATKHELVAGSQIQYKERQLAEVYGPIYAMLKRGRALVRFWREGKLQSIEGQFWELARQTNLQIEQILLTKSHLIEGSEIPRSYLRFLMHVPLWHSFTQVHQGKVPYSPEEFPELYFTDEFENDIYQTTERLKRELDELHKKFGIGPEQP